MRITPLLALAALATTASAKIVRPLPLPPGDKPSAAFTLKVDGVEVPVAFGTFNGGQDFHHAAFEMEGSTRLSVSLASGKTASITVKPTRHGIKGETAADGFSFSIQEPLKLVIEAEGERPMFVFALPPEKNVPKKGDPGVIYFGPGVHEAGRIRPKSGETVYIAAGATVKGSIYAFESSNITIRGRGVLDARGKTSFEKKTHAMLFERCQGITVEGIQLRAGDWWQSHFHLTSHVKIDHFHTMSFGRNNDGVDIDGVTDLAVRDSFIGCGDDGFGWHAVDAVAFGETPTRDCLAERCVIWNEHAGNGLRLGASLETKVFENITFRDIDVIHVSKGGVAIMSDHSDWAHLRNILFDGFHNESDKALMILSLKKTRYSNNTGYRDERGTISDIYFNNVTSVDPRVILEGVDEKHAITDLYFAGCSLGGQPLAAASQLKINNFVSRLNFVSKLPARKVYPIEKNPTRELKELLIDDGDEGFWAFGGDKLVELKDVPKAEGGDSRSLPLGWANGAVYTPALAGNYEISVHWGEHQGVAAKAPWTVHHPGGYTTSLLDQNNSAGWHTLGTFELDGESWVRLADPHYQLSDGTVIADAVRFRRME